MQRSNAIICNQQSITITIWPITAINVYNAFLVISGVHLPENPEMVSSNR